MLQALVEAMARARSSNHCRRGTHRQIRLHANPDEDHDDDADDDDRSIDRSIEFPCWEYGMPLLGFPPLPLLSLPREDAGTGDVEGDVRSTSRLYTGISSTQSRIKIFLLL